MDILGDKIGTTESVKGRATYDRDIYSVNASYDWALTDKDNLTKTSHMKNTAKTHFAP